jgi:uncharacterized protein with von Willebrand factor type A (vWA) domain
MTKETQEELLKMLDIGLSDVGDEELLAEGLSFDEFGPEDREEELSETVLRQDDWDRAVGEEVMRRHSLGDDAKAVADFHSASYHLSPEPAGKCINKRRQEFMDTLMESPEYKQLHESTRQNRLASEVAAVRFTRQYQALVEKDKKNPPAGMGLPGEGEGEPDGNVLVAVGKAVQGAQEEVDQIEDMTSALGGDIGGLGQGDAAQSANIDKIRDTYERLRGSKRLRDIFERAGAYIRSAKGLQKNKTQHGFDDIVGVEQAGDVGRLLASELAYLDDPDLELDLLRRIVENQAMCQLYQGVEAQMKGPVVVVVDESGSMAGAPIANAKALALAMAWIAKHQKRWCALVGFSGGTSGTMCVLKPGKWDQSDLLDWLDHFYGGGTTLDVPLDKLPNEHWAAMDPPRGKTDVIMVTDAMVTAPQRMVEQFNAWKVKEKVRCISIVLGSRAGDLEKVSNEVHCIPGLTVDCTAAASCMSI